MSKATPGQLSYNVNRTRRMLVQLTQAAMRRRGTRMIMEPVLGICILGWACYRCVAKHPAVVIAGGAALMLVATAQALPTIG